MYAINKDLEHIPSAEATRRIALVDLDWGRMRAVDIFALLRSFMPKTGRQAAAESTAAATLAGWETLVPPAGWSGSRSTRPTMGWRR